MSAVDADFSLLIWALGVVVAALAMHLGQGWVRMARLGAAPGRDWRALLLAAAAMGIGSTAALAVGRQAQELPFLVGYRWPAVALLVPLALLAFAPAAVVAARSARALTLLASGGLLAVAVLVIEVGWVHAAGFRPGIVWRFEGVAAAALLLAGGLGAAQWLAFSAGFQESPKRRLWRGAASLLAAVTLLLGQGLLAWAAGLPSQFASTHQGALPGWWLSLVGGVLVPLGLVAMLLDLWLRRRQLRERQPGDLKLAPQRKRRFKVRVL